MQEFVRRRLGAWIGVDGVELEVPSRKDEGLRSRKDRKNDDTGCKKAAKHNAISSLCKS